MSIKDRKPKDRPGYVWVYCDGCDCAACPWGANCVGREWPHWESKKSRRRHTRRQHRRQLREAREAGLAGSRMRRPAERQGQRHEGEQNDCRDRAPGHGNGPVRNTHRAA